MSIDQSFIDIVNLQQEVDKKAGISNSGGSKSENGAAMSDLGCFTVKATDSGPEEERTVNIKILDVLFDDQVSSLVYMTDLTKVIRENEQRKTQESLLATSTWIAKELQGPQDSALSLSE